jgi:hypothetical protein
MLHTFEIRVPNHTSPVAVETTQNFNSQGSVLDMDKVLFVFSHDIQTSSGAHPASYQRGIRGHFLDVKWLQGDADC